MGAEIKHLFHQFALAGPAGVQLLQLLALFDQFRLGSRFPCSRLDPHHRFALDDLQFRLQGFDPPAAVVHFGRYRILADGDPCAGGIQQADRFIGQLAGRNVAMRKPHGGFDGFVQHLDLMVLLHHRGHAAHHQDGLFLAGFADLDDLEAAGERRIFFDMLLVFGPRGGSNGPQRAAGQGWFEQVGRVASAGRAACADQRVRFIHEQNDRLLRRLDLVDHLAQPLFEFAFHARPGLQQPDIQGQQRDVLQRGRHVAGGDAECKAFDDRGLPHPGFARENRVVLAAAHENIHDLPDLFVAADDRIDFALSRPLGQIHGEPPQGLPLAHRGRW